MGGFLRRDAGRADLRIEPLEDQSEGRDAIQNDLGAALGLGLIEQGA
jgi:hypothetical protein